MLKNILIPAVLLITLFILAILGLGAYTAYQFTRPVSVLNSSVRIEKKLVPDTATNTISIETKIGESGNNVFELNQISDKIVSSVLEYLKSENIKSTDITTNKYTTQNYNKPYTEGVPQEEMVVADITVKFHNVDTNPTKPNEIASKVLGLGATRVGQFSYESSNSKDVCEQMESQALLAVRDKSIKEVKALGGQIIKLEPNIQQSCNNAPIFYGGSMTSKSFDSTAAIETVAPIMTGENTLTVIAVSKAEYRF